MNSGIFDLLKRLWKFISNHRRYQYGFLIFLMIAVSFAEVVSIGAVIPFLGVLAEPDFVFQHRLMQPILQLANIQSSSDLILPLTLFFMFAILVTGFMRISLTWLLTRISFATGADLGANIYKKTLYQPYSSHVLSNSSEVINGIVRKTDFIIQGIILSITTLISAAFFLVIILTALILIYPEMAISVFLGFGIIYSIIIFFTRKRLLSNGSEVADKTSVVMKTLQESMGGIKDVIIDGTQETFYNNFRKADVTLRRAQANTTIIVSTPKYGIEALGMILISGIALFFSAKQEGLVVVIPILGALALGAQRLLPILQQGYAAWSSIRGGQASLADILVFLEKAPQLLEGRAVSDITFDKEIVIKDLNFRYSTDSNFILENINISIPKGSTVGFIGPTGTGKTTLLDIMLGLLDPSSGEIKIDNITLDKNNIRAWQDNISHVPQSIFLSDSSITENIAFGIPLNEIDHDRIQEAAEKSCITSFINNLPDKFNTIVGERGVRLSGGQKQRIGIARALYKKTKLIVFDEATSSLDSETEAEVMGEITNLDHDITLLIIAHRVSTLKNCDFIVKLSSKGAEKLKYDEVLNNPEDDQ